MTFSKSIQKRIETQTGEKLFSQAEVDTLVAAAYEDAAKKVESTLYFDKVDHLTDDHHKLRDWIAADIRRRTPADAQKAMAEHDAALRDELKRCQKNYGKLVTVANEAGTITAKLEAENAGLRDRFHKAMKKAGVQGLVIAKVFALLTVRHSHD